MKPENILLGRDGHIRLTDFDLARPAATTTHVHSVDDRTKNVDVRPASGGPVTADSVLFSAIYPKCPYYFVLYMQSVLIISCFIYKVSLLCSALYAKCPCYAVLYIQRVLII